MDEIDRKLAKITQRMTERRQECPACEARLERAAILEFDAWFARPEAERLARIAHPCGH